MLEQERKEKTERFIWWLCLVITTGGGNDNGGSQLFSFFLLFLWFTDLASLHEFAFTCLLFLLIFYTAAVPGGNCRSLGVCLSVCARRFLRGKKPRIVLFFSRWNETSAHFPCSTALMVDVHRRILSLSPLFFFMFTANWNPEQRFFGVVQFFCLM